ncbi:CHAT domain-containing protein [Roseibium sp.]|uniref:CHAT domain-containing protein n=1 Tax=Roseibium sp. TaxID=1936156 RepID=UPI003D0FE022
MILRSVFARVLSAFALFLIGTASSFAEGLTIGGAHPQLQAVAQNENATMQQLDAAVTQLTRLIDLAEAQYGKNSVQVGALLIDIGEAAVRRGLLYSGKESEDQLRRGIRALEAGEPLLKPFERQYVGATIHRARAYLMMGRAHLKAKRYEDAEKALRQGLAIHWKRFDDHAWQLQFFPYLYDAVQHPDEKLKVAEGELKIARATGNKQFVGAARKRLARAENLTASISAELMRIRMMGEKLAKNGDSHQVRKLLEETWEQYRTNQREINTFSQLLRPSIFYIYDPTYPGREYSFSDFLQATNPYKEYDGIAARFFSEKRIPIIIKNENIRVNNRTALLHYIVKIYDAGHHDEAFAFCKIIPLTIQHDGSLGVREYCDAREFSYFLTQTGDYYKAIDILNISKKYFEKKQSTRSNFSEEIYERNLIRLAEIHKNYGKPDGFFEAYENVSEKIVDEYPALKKYAWIISENSTLQGDQLKIDYESIEELEEGWIQKWKLLPNYFRLTSSNLAKHICKLRTDLEYNFIRDYLCALSDQNTANDSSSSVSSLPLEARYVEPDFGLFKLIHEGKYKTLSDNYKANLGGDDGWSTGDRIDFDIWTPSKQEKNIISQKLTLSEFQKSDQGNADLNYSDAVNPVRVAASFQSNGQINLARTWATPAAERYRAASPPGYVDISWLSQEFDRQTYLDGWRWLIIGLPVIAETRFSPTQRLTEDWETNIGAFHGRMIARRQIGDQKAAAEDAFGLIEYVSGTLAGQSFNRNETREVIARVARHALREAVTALRAYEPENREHKAALFEIAQLLNLTSTSRTVTRLGARLDSISPELAELARERENLRRKWQETDRENEPDEKKRLQDAVDALDTRLKAEFPEYVELAGAISVSDRDLRRELNTDEAVISFISGMETTLVVAQTFRDIFVVESQLSRSDLEGLVSNLRRGLEIRGGRLPRFRQRETQTLYESLLASVIDQLPSRVNKLIMIPTGALESIPFSALVVEASADNNLSETKWLSDSYAVSRLPSPGAFVMLRSASNPAPSPKPFLGIGDPALEGEPETSRGLLASAIYSTRGAVNVETLRQLPRLPDTQDELKTLQTEYNATDEALLLGEAANEPNLRAQDLSAYKTVAFATHGLVAGELTGLQEPGLVLTPPKESNEADDGFLAASEIAQLNLNADIVLLSACNTAAPEGEGAEGLSGLAKSFFLAGARNLLVSHWAVDSASATSLTTGMVRHKQSEPDLTYSEALQRSMRDLRTQPDGKYAHPALWAPFEIVGG